MGGGAAMRAAAKVAGFTVVNGGRRVLTSEHYPVSSASRIAASSRSGAEDMRLVASPAHGGMERTCADIDDWVFAGGEEEAADTMPRVVFGGGHAPTMQEAKEATSDLAEALEKTYLSIPNSVGMLVGDSVSSLSVSNSQEVVNKACVTSEIAVAPAVSSSAIKAFKLLHESPAAQNVVASIACDPNVWNAVLQNQELQEFLHSQRTCETCSNVNLDMEELVADSDFHDNSSPKSSYGSSDDIEYKPQNGLKHFIEEIKGTVVGMISSLSDYFQIFFGGKGFNTVESNSDGTARLRADTVMEASFMGLAVMAILVILVKRT